MTLEVLALNFTVFVTGGVGVGVGVGGAGVTRVSPVTLKKLVAPTSVLAPVALLIRYRLPVPPVLPAYRFPSGPKSRLPPLKPTDPTTVAAPVVKLTVTRLEDPLRRRQ